MDNFNNRNLYPEDDWQNISTPILKEQNILNQESSEEVSVSNKKPSKHPVLTIQLILAICVLLFLFTLKFLGAPLFDTITSWYDNEISKSVIFNGDFENFDFSSVFATADES